MKNQPLPDYKSNDVVQTPQPLAEAIVRHFVPENHKRCCTYLEPCAGGGAFVRALENYGCMHVIHREIKEGLDFFDYDLNDDWIITNPPFSKVGDWREYSYLDNGQSEWTQWFEKDDTDNRNLDHVFRNYPNVLKRRTRTRIGFLEKSFQVASNVVFLLTLNHALGMKSRFNLCDRYGFGVREIVLVDTPPKETGWPQAGFQTGAVYWQEGYSGDWKITDLRGQVDYRGVL